MYIVPDKDDDTQEIDPITLDIVRPVQIKIESPVQSRTVAHYALGLLAALCGVWTLTCFAFIVCLAMVA